MTYEDKAIENIKKEISKRKLHHLTYDAAENLIDFVATLPENSFLDNKYWWKSQKDLNKILEITE